MRRPQDQNLWRFNEPGILKYLVLDELHTYDGAQGSDVACLVRRLKERLGAGKGSLCVVGTSATLDDRAALQRRAQRLDDMDHLLVASTTERFRYVERLARAPIATQETLDLWIGWWRDVLLLAADAGVPLTNVDRDGGLRDYARRFGTKRSAAVIQALRSASDRLDHNANPRLTLEVLMLDLPHP